MENQTPGKNNHSLNGTTSGTNTTNSLTPYYYSYPSGYQYYYMPQQWYPNWYPSYPSYPYQPLVPIINNPPIVINTPSTQAPITRNALNKMPQVHITAGKSRTKLFGSNVYMPDNTDFEIELFNPSNETLGVKFKMNGQYISTSMLVLYPGKHMFLDRYLNENKKFKYITYTVDDNSESKEAIAENGNIQVEFYREVWVTDTKKSPLTLNGLTSGTVNLRGSNTTTVLNSPSNQTFYCASFNNANQNIGSTLTSSTSDMYKSTLYDANANNQKDIVQDWLSDELKKEFNELETGMIAKGEKSDTEFNDVDINFETLCVSKFNFKILPLSQKPIEPKDLVVVCSNLNCKKKAKRGDKHCSECGTKL